MHLTMLYLLWGSSSVVHLSNTSSVSFHLVSFRTNRQSDADKTFPSVLSICHTQIYFWYIGFPLLCLSDTDITTTNLIYVYSSFISPNNWSWYSSINMPFSTISIPKQYFDSNGDASSTKLWYLQSTLQVLKELFPFFPVQIMPARTFLLYCSCYLLSNAMF